MRSHVQRFAVEYVYPVCFTEAAFSPQNTDLPDVIGWRELRRHRVAFVLDGGLLQARPTLAEEIHQHAATFADRIELAGNPAVVPGGEESKNDPAHLRRLLLWANELGLDRHAFIVAVGGGAVLDLAGFAAATAHRGVRLIRVPSTVLAQADAGVGVKNGVNAFGQKNYVGTFAPPFGVVIDFQLLDTLPERDRRAGMAEAVKVALVRDAAFFEWIRENLAALRSGNREALSLLVRRTAELHLRHIAQGGDPFEAGTARPLDFGHWAAHKLEILSGHRLRHGEAVAIGMALDCLYATQAGLLDEGESDQVLEVLRGLGFVLWDDALGGRGEGGASGVIDGIEEFRQHMGGELTLTLLRRIGEGIDVHHIDLELVRRAIDRLAEEAGDEIRAIGNGAHVLHQRPSGNHLARGSSQPGTLRRPGKSTSVR